MKYIVFLISVFLTSVIIAQNKTEQGTTHISLVAKKSKDEKNIQFRFFASDISILKRYAKNGAILEVASKNNPTEFKKLKEIKPYTNQQIDALIATVTKEEEEKLLIAKSFLESLQSNKEVTISDDKMLENILEAKENQDFEVVLILFQTLQNKNSAKVFGFDFSTPYTSENNIYQVKILGEEGLQEIISNPFSLDMLPKNEKRKISTEIGDKQLSFSWKKSKLSIGAIEVERKTGNSPFKKLTKTPEYNIADTSINTFTDKDLTNYTVYTYRFYTYTIFGDKELVGEVIATPKDLTPPQQPIILKPEHISENQVKIKWKLNNPDKDLKGFIVLRGKENEGQYKLIHNKILHKSTRSYIDKGFSKDGSNYYLIQAIDTANNVSNSLPAYVTLTDSIPPSKPKFISAKMDSLGIVTINIAKNKEKDLMGYRLFRSNSKDHEFSPIKEHFIEKDTLNLPVKTVYKDTVTLNSLTKNVFYKVKALDFNHNQSEFSDILKVKRIDTIPPVTPVFKDVTVTEKGIILSFAFPQDEDVITNELYRRKKGETTWNKLTELKKTDSVFTDTKTKRGVFYQYALRSKDDSNLSSPYSIPVTVKALDTGIREGITNLQVKQQNKKTRLTWVYSASEEKPVFVIYKSGIDGNLEQIASVENRFYEDVIENRKVEYAVRVFTRDGGKSKISKTVSYEK